MRPSVQASGPPSASAAGIGTAARIPRAPALPAEERGRSQASPELERAHGQIERLRAQLERLASERSAMRARAEKAERDAEHKAAELDKLLGQHETLKNLASLRAERIRELEGALEQRERAEGALAAELAALEARLGETEDRLSAAEARLRASDATPPPADDLQRIYGIGPAYAQKLIAIGVTRWQQIAAWTDADIDEVAERIGIHAARIRKHDWRASAAALLEAAPPKASDDGDLSW